MGGRVDIQKSLNWGPWRRFTDKGHSVTSVSGRLGVSTKSLYDWVKLYGDQQCKLAGSVERDEIRRLKSELRRVTEERDILKKATAYFAKESR